MQYSSVCMANLPVYTGVAEGNVTLMTVTKSETLTFN